MSRSEIAVSVAYAESDRQTVIELAVPCGTTAREAIERSGIRERHPGIAAAAPLGIFGRLIAPATVLEDGDRVELYRGLPADPKETRRRLAREGRTMGRPR